MSAPPQEGIAQLCAEFRLPTVAAEVGPRFQASDHGAALATLLEVFELEAGDRRQRRVARGLGALSRPMMWGPPSEPKEASLPRRNGR